MSPSLSHFSPRVALRAGLLALLALSFAPPVLAQDTSGIDEIVVTARKREESLQDTPLSVSALSEEMIKDLGIATTDDIASIAPNTYVFQPPGNSTSVVVAMRGVSSAEPLLTVDSGVALYLDGAYLARTANSAVNIVDLERVEVLRGPQGTLYGRNATGGAINFITKQPQDDFGVTQEFSLGRYARFHSRTVIETGELGDSGFAASLTYQHQERDGWINDLNAPDNIDPDAFNNDSIRFAARWNATEDLSVRYSYDRARLEGTKDYFHVFGLSGGVANALRDGTQPTVLIQGPDLANSPQAALAFLLEDPPNIPQFLANGGSFTAQAPTSSYDESLVGNTGPPKTVRQNEGLTENDIDGHNLTVEYAAGPDLTIKSITTYREWDNIVGGGDLGALGGINTNNAYKVYSCGTVADLEESGANVDPSALVSCFGAALQAAGAVATDTSNPAAAQQAGTDLAAVGTTSPTDAFAVPAAARTTLITRYYTPDQLPVQSPVEDSSLFTATNRRTHEQFSQELQFLGALEEANLDYVVGAYYFSEEGSERNPQEFLAATPWLDGDPTTWEFIDFTGPEQTLQDDGVVQGGLSDFGYDSEAESWAVFGSVNWQPIERLSVSAGVRYSEDEKDLLLIGVRCGINIGQSQDEAVASRCPTGKTDVAQSRDFDHVDYDVSATYALNDEVNVYLRYATAYLAGGFNPRASQLGIDYDYDQEELSSVEAGVKALLLDNRLQLNASVFFSQYEDIQTQSFLAGVGGAASVTDNAGEAEFAGVEVEMLALPTDYLALYLNAGYIDMEYKEFLVRDPGILLMAEDQITVTSDGTVVNEPDGLPDAANPQPCSSAQIPGCNRFFERPIDLANDIPGFQPPFAYRPEWTLSAGAEFHGELGSTGVEFSARLDIRRVENIGDWTATPNCWPSGAPATPFAAGGEGTCAIMDPANPFHPNPSRAYLSEDGFTVVDARITLSNIRITGEYHASVSLWGKNITDEEYIRSGIDFAGLGFGGISWGAPAVFGLDLNFQF